MNYTLQEIHNLGMNYIGKRLEQMGFEFLAINSGLNVNPQFVAFKKGEGTTLVLVKTVLYPNDPEEISPPLIEKLKNHALEQNVKLWVAGVGLAHAYDVEKPLTREDDFLVKFDGFRVILD